MVVKKNRIIGLMITCLKNFIRLCIKKMKRFLDNTKENILPEEISILTILITII